VILSTRQPRNQKRTEYSHTGDTNEHSKF
jgi:hypothetical protein